jgi:hypothetical protein
VTIDEDGTTHSPFWDVAASGVYAAPFAALTKTVKAARVTGVYYPKAPVLGTPESGGWTHWAVRVPAEYTLHPKATLTPAQARAEKAEDHKNVLRALDEFSADDLAMAYRVLSAEALYRGEKLLGAAEWLADLQRIRQEIKNKRVKDALIWRAVALAPAGFCHPRAGVLGTLLEDIAARLPFEDIKRRFDAKMHPLLYQRPQAAPAAATIAQAEKLFETLALAPALKRRFARLDEIEALWRPTPPAPVPAQGGIFSHLTPKGQDQQERDLVLPPMVMTWDKFRRTVLPGAERIEVLVPHHAAPYAFLTTAVEPDAPPLLQWDTPERRNPVAWYMYLSGNPPHQVGLTGGAWTEVLALTTLPPAWYEGKSTHHGEAIIVCLEGCHDAQNRGGLGLFPELLRTELHGVRSVIEAHSRSGCLEETEGPLAAGIRLTKGANFGNVQVRVTSKGHRACYQLDRWD